MPGVKQKEEPFSHTINPIERLRLQVAEGEPPEVVAKWLVIALNSYVRFSSELTEFSREAANFLDDPEGAFELICQYVPQLQTDSLFVSSVKEEFVRLVEWGRHDPRKRLLWMSLDLSRTSYVQAGKRTKDKFMGIRLPGDLVRSIGDAVRAGRAENASEFVRSLLQAYFAWAEMAQVPFEAELGDTIAGLMDHPVELLTFWVFRQALSAPDRIQAIREPLAQALSVLTQQSIEEARKQIESATQLLSQTEMGDVAKDK